MGVKGQCGQKYIADVLFYKILHRCSIIQEKHTLKMLGHVMILTPLETNGSLRSAASKKIGIMGHQSSCMVSIESLWRWYTISACPRI